MLSVFRTVLFRPAARSICMSSIRYASTMPVTVNPTAEEVSAGKLGARNLEQAIRSLHEDGLVVVSNVISHSVLDRLNAKMVEDARLLQQRKDVPFNYNPGNLQQDPPPIREFFDQSIFLNPIATQITTNMLGPIPKWTFCSGNTAMPPVKGLQPQRQPVHTDADFEHPTHPFALVVNVPLIRFTPNNGTTEVWLGTHTGDLAGLKVQEGRQGDRASGRIKPELLEARRKVRGPSQPVLEKGSIVIRDLRLWHAGMPNLTRDVRVMLAMKLEDDIKPLIESQTGLEVPVQWVTNQEAKERYLNRGFGNSYNFGQDA